VEARDLFQSRKYGEALAIYVRLYADTHHPTYLRNIGRCHQMMREPDPAIDSFRRYLRDARDLGRAERAEIEGYITEMQRRKVNAPPTAPPPADSGPAASPSWSPGAPSTTSVTAAAGRDGEVAKPITQKWWFWTGLGAVVVAGVIAAVAIGGGQDHLPCPTRAECPP
jgi:hypothetical protein